MPLLAEIADKMPAPDSLWLIWLCVAGISMALVAALSRLRLWLGFCVVVVSGLLALLNGLPDSTMDRAILRELGFDYLTLWRGLGALPLAGAATIWTGIAVRRSLNH